MAPRKKNVSQGVTETTANGQSFWPKVIALACLGLFFVATAVYLGTREEKDLFVPLLSLLPSLLAAIIIWRLRDNHRVAAVSLIAFAILVAQLGLWVLFCLSPQMKELLPYLAGASLVAAGIVVWVAGWATSGLMRHNIARSNNLSARITSALMEFPFSGVCYFLMLFLFETFFLGYALAFHDQGEEKLHKRIGLYAERLPVGLRDKDDGSYFGKTWDIWFTKGSAIVEIDPKSELLPPEFIGDLKLERQKLAHNTQQILEVVKALRGNAPGDRVQVMLVGHADDTPVDARKLSYNSNFELSQARIHQVVVKIMQRLESSDERWQGNVEWLVMPFSNSKEHLQLNRQYNYEANDAQLAVEIAVLPPHALTLRMDDRLPGLGRKLDLLDYVYFMVYTITTTGYGDIIPVSAFAKFVTSLANFVEIFFVVVFFNVLLSFLGSQNGRRRTSEKANGRSRGSAQAPEKAPEKDKSSLNPTD